MSARTVGARRGWLPVAERMSRRAEDGIGPVEALVADPTAEIRCVPAALVRRMAERFEDLSKGRRRNSPRASY